VSPHHNEPIGTDASIPTTRPRIT